MTSNLRPLLFPHSLLLRSLLDPSLGFPAPRTFSPAVRLDEAEGQVALHLDLPGVAKADLEIETVGDTLTVSGKRTFGGQELTFSRSFTLGEDIDPAGIKAALKDGVLSVTLPRKPEAQPQKQRIQIA